MPDLLQPARIAAQSVTDAAGATLAGVLLNALWLPSSATAPLPARLPSRLRRWLLSAALLQLAGFAAVLLLVTAIMADAASLTALRAALPDVLATEAGHTLALSCDASALLLFVLVLAFARPRPWLQRRSLILTALALTAALAAARSPLGHASADGPWSLREAMQCLHLIAVAVWGGSVLVAGFVTVPALTAQAPPQATLAFARSLSRTVTVALPLVILSGLYASWTVAHGAWSALPQATWGQLLASKLAIVLVAAALGSRLHLLLRAQPSLSPAADVAHLRRWLRFEAFAMLLILLLSGWLANAPPPDAM